MRISNWSSDVCSSDLRDGAGRADVDGRIFLLRQRGSAEAGADRAAQREGVAEVVAGRDLADGRVAEVGIILITAGKVDGPVFDGFRDQVDITRPRAAAELARAIGRAHV